MSRCPFCDRPVRDSVSKQVAMTLFYEGVNIFDFATGDLVASIKEFDDI